MEAEKDRQRLDRQRALQQRRRESSLAEMASSAEAKAREFDAKTKRQAITMTNERGMAVKDDSKRAYFREFRKVIDAADVILEVLDARDPIGCRAPQIEEMILQSGAGKKIILVLNKIDLVPRETVMRWLKYLRNDLPTVAFKSSLQTQRSNLGQDRRAPLAEGVSLGSNECFGADALIKLLKNYCRSGDLKTTIRVGVIGYPNVGKSSLINSLKRSHVVGVGSTPGFTKTAQVRLFEGLQR